MEIKVIGGGPGAESFLTVLARQLIKEADLLISNHRFGAWLKNLNDNFLEANLSETKEILKKQQNKNLTIAVVVSGDVNFYSFSKLLKEEFIDFKMEFIPGISSLQYLMAKIKKDYNGLKTVSLHGRNKSAVPYVAYNERLFLLTGGNNKAHDIISELKEVGFKDLELTVAENLGQNDEKIRSGTLDELSGQVFVDLAVIYIENKGFVNPWETIFDDQFIRAKVPMTKGSVRAVCLEELALEPKDIVYDVGAGTGSVSIVMARKAFEGTVFAIESKKEAQELIRENIKKFKAFNTILVSGQAPQALEDLPMPDKVFIGGSTGKLNEIVEICLNKNPKVIFLLTSVTLETLNEALNCFKGLNHDYKFLLINSAFSNELGNYTLMKANNPIFIIKSQAVMGRSS